MLDSNDRNIKTAELVQKRRAQKRLEREMNNTRGGTHTPADSAMGFVQVPDLSPTCRALTFVFADTGMGQLVCRCVLRPIVL